MPITVHAHGGTQSSCGSDRPNRVDLNGFVDGVLVQRFYRRHDSYSFRGNITFQVPGGSTATLTSVPPGCAAGTYELSYFRFD